MRARATTTLATIVAEFISGLVLVLVIVALAALGVLVLFVAGMGVGIFVLGFRTVIPT